MNPGVMIVTGARKGLGRALAEHYLAQGWIVAGCSRQPSDLVHPAYTHTCLDVADEAAVVAMVRSTARAHGRIDALVNNAGAAAMNHLLLTPLSSLRTALDTNFVGTFLFLRETAKAMSRQPEGGRIVNFSSVAAPLNLEGEAAYAASKAAVESLTRTAARELASKGVTVNAVGPSPIDTDLTRAVPRDKMDALLGRQALKAKATPADVANVVDFLISPASAQITGQVIYLGGVNG